MDVIKPIINNIESTNYNNKCSLTGKYLKYYERNKHKKQTRRIYNYLTKKYGGVAVYNCVYIPPPWVY